MQKTGEDQPPKKATDDTALEKLANPHPKADMDGSYQDNKGRQEDVDGKKNADDAPVKERS